MEMLDSYHDLRRVMKTCRALYHLGVPILMHDVDMTDSMRRPMALRYLEVDPERYRHIRSLKCTYQHLHSALAGEQPLDLLVAARRMQTLRVVQDPSYALVSIEGIINWVASLPCLRHLELAQVPASEEHILELLRTTQAQFETLHIHKLEPLVQSPQEGPPLPVEPIYPIQAIQQFASTLRELSISFNRADAASLEDLLGEALVFPLVTKLHWQSRLFIDIGALVDTFPNLQDLSVRYAGMTDLYDLILGTWPEETMIEFRERNRQTQLTKQWDTLEHLTGDVSCLWTFGLCYPVRHLTIIAHEGLATEGRVHDVLQACQPTILEFSVSFDPYMYPNIARILALANVEEMVLHTSFYEKMTDLHHAVDTLVRSLLPFLSLQAADNPNFGTHRR